MRRDLDLVQVEVLVVKQQMVMRLGREWNYGLTLCRYHQRKPAHREQHRHFRFQSKSCRERVGSTHRGVKRALHNTSPYPLPVSEVTGLNIVRTIHSPLHRRKVSFAFREPEDILMFISCAFSLHCTIIAVRTMI